MAAWRGETPSAEPDNLHAFATPPLDADDTRHSVVHRDGHSGDDRDASDSVISEDEALWIEQFVEDEAVCADHGADSSADEDQPTASDLAFINDDPEESNYEDSGESDA